MRLVSYNILDGGIGRADPIAEILDAAQADIVALLEADDRWVVDRIARRLKMDVAYAQGKRHRSAILSRWPIAWSINRALLQDAITNSFVQAEIIDPSGMAWNVSAVHLHPHGTLADEAVRLGELAAILETLRPLREHATPHLLVGDFNANSPIQRIIPENCKPRTRKHWEANGGMLPREAIASLLSVGYVDTLHANLGEKAGTQGSFSTQFPGQRVDFIFAHGISAGQIANAWIEEDRLATYASDHYPVGVEITNSAEITSPAGT